MIKITQFYATTYRKWGKFCWAKLSRYSHYMDFPGYTFAMQDEGAYVLYLEQKIHGKNFCTLHKNRESLAQQIFPHLCYIVNFHRPSHILHYS